MPDHQGYPTSEELERIRTWDLHDPRGWLEYCRGLWHYPDYWTVDGIEQHVSTGGWSGNEEIIEAMQRAHYGLLWHQVWQQTRRGGHYTFTVA